MVAAMSQPKQWCPLVRRVQQVPVTTRVGGCLVPPALAHFMSCRALLDYSALTKNALVEPILPGHGGAVDRAGGNSSQSIVPLPCTARRYVSLNREKLEARQRGLVSNT